MELCFREDDFSLTSGEVANAQLFWKSGYFHGIPCNYKHPKVSDSVAFRHYTDCASQEKYCYACTKTTQNTEHILPSSHDNLTTAQYISRPSIKVCIKLIINTSGMHDTIRYQWKCLGHICSEAFHTSEFFHAKNNFPKYGSNITKVNRRKKMKMWK